MHLKSDKNGDAVGRPSCRSSLLPAILARNFLWKTGHPNQPTKKALNSVSTCGKSLQRAAVGIRALCGFPSAASVSTGPLFFLFCYFFLSSCLALVFHREMPRQDRPGTTIPNLVDPRHTLFCPSSNAFHFPKEDRRRRLIAQRLMRAFVIVKSEIAFEIVDGFQHVDVILQINLFVFHRPP